MYMNCQIAQTHVEKLCKERKFLAAENVIEFLEICLPSEEVATLRSYAKSEEEVHVQAQKELKKQQSEQWIKDNKYIDQTYFTWQEMINILGKIGGVVTFKSTKRGALFSRYDKFGQLISTIGKDYYGPLKHQSEETLAEYRTHTYKIDCFYSSWNSYQVAEYLRNREVEQIAN